jgi:hypothetical protein
MVQVKSSKTKNPYISKEEIRRLSIKVTKNNGISVIAKITPSKNEIIYAKTGGSVKK